MLMVASVYYCMGERHAAVEHAAIAADAAARFPGVVSPHALADAHDRHGQMLARLLGSLIRH